MFINVLIPMYSMKRPLTISLVLLLTISMISIPSQADNFDARDIFELDDTLVYNSNFSYIVLNHHESDNIFVNESGLDAIIYSDNTTDGFMEITQFQLREGNNNSFISYVDPHNGLAYWNDESGNKAPLINVFGIHGQTAFFRADISNFTLGYNMSGFLNATVVASSYTTDTGEIDAWVVHEEFNNATIQTNVTMVLNKTLGHLIYEYGNVNVTNPYFTDNERQFNTTVYMEVSRELHTSGNAQDLGIDYEQERPVPTEYTTETHSDDGYDSTNVSTSVVGNEFGDPFSGELPFNMNFLTLGFLFTMAITYRIRSKQDQ